MTAAISALPPEVQACTSSALACCSHIFCSRCIPHQTPLLLFSIAEMDIPGIPRPNSMWCEYIKVPRCHRHFGQIIWGPAIRISNCHRHRDAGKVTSSSVLDPTRRHHLAYSRYSPHPRHHQCDINIVATAAPTRHDRRRDIVHYTNYTKS